jgi:hypothetical protein
MDTDNYALRSHASIGRELGISPCRVRQIEQRALRKLRKAFTTWGVYKLKDGRDSVLDGSNASMVLIVCVCSLALLCG